MMLKLYAFFYNIYLFFFAIHLLNISFIFKIGQVDSQLTFVPEKSGKPHKLNFQAKIQNQNKLDLEYHLTYVKPTGEDLDAKLCIKRTKNGDRSVYENQVNNLILINNMLKKIGILTQNCFLGGIYWCNSSNPHFLLWILRYEQR